MNPCGTLRIPRIFRRRQRPRRIPRTRRRCGASWQNEIEIDMGNGYPDVSFPNHPMNQSWDWFEMIGWLKYRVLQKKVPAIHRKKNRDTLLTPATPNFNVVIGSAQLFFLKAAKHKIQKTTLNWGTGGHDLCMTSVVWYSTSWDGCFFEELGMFGWDWQMLGWIYQAFQTVAFEKSHPLCLAINWILSTMGSTLIPMCNYPHSGMSSNQCFQVQAPKDDPYSNSYLQPFSPQTSLPLGRAAPADAACAEEAGGEDRGARCRAGGNQGAERIILQQWQCWLEELGL